MTTENLHFFLEDRRIFNSSDIQVASTQQMNILDRIEQYVGSTSETFNEEQEEDVPGKIFSTIIPQPIFIYI